MKELLWRCKEAEERAERMMWKDERVLCRPADRFWVLGWEHVWWEMVGHYAAGEM